MKHRGLYERDGVYYVRVPRADGKGYDRHSLRTRDASEAARRAESKLAAHRAGVNSNLLWQDLVDVYEEEHFPHLREGTQQTYKWAIVALTPILYDQPVRSIDNPMLNRFVDARFGAGITRGGIRSELAVLSSILGWAEGRPADQPQPGAALHQGQ